MHQKFLPVTEKVIRWHLSGRDDHKKPFVMGIYPMLIDESCHFLAVDFDGEHWREDSLAYLNTCHDVEIPAVLERSRSGNGGHVWIFFDEAIPASLARQLGAHLLTETMEARPETGFKSYDRFFPNQDTLPRGGFGNLIALPLQYDARQTGNSVFIDNNFTPFEDQWAFLSQIERLSKSKVQGIVESAYRRGRIIGVRAVSSEGDDFALEPWRAPPSRQSPLPAISGPLPQTLQIVLADGIYIPKSNLPPALRNRLIRIAAFQNPEFYRAQAMRLPTYDKPRIVSCAEIHEQHIQLPRGCYPEVIDLLHDLKIDVEIDDQRHPGQSLDLTFQGKLWKEQEKAVRAMLADDTGVLAATTAFGKTVVAAWLIAQRNVNTLVLVHRQQLMEQWKERLAAFLNIPEKEIGRLGGGRKKLHGKVDIALIQSLVRKGNVDDRIAGYGHVIVDECHHISARSFELAVSRAKAKYVTGLSATVMRKDGHHPIVFMQCGPVRYRVDAKEQAERRQFSQTVIVRPTGFQSMAEASEDKRVEYQQYCEELIQNEPRNQLICADVAQAVKDGRSPLVLTERTEHLEILAGQLTELGIDTVSLRGGLKKSDLNAALAKVADGSQPKATLATGRFAGEGFDESRLDTLFLTMPVSWRGTIAQYAGRLHRLHEDKREVRIYDYADFEIPMLARMFDKRQKGYESIGYAVTIPASVLPGWPAEVPLPFDSCWKQDHLDSVQRLIRDGVDAQLARLFSEATQSISQDTQGIERARSASEAFLFRRLESLPETAGYFLLNQELPIAFGERQMEVDLFCQSAKLVVEIDGSQHLTDATAYRRDRYKDALLQEHGFVILRFLADDLGKRLDLVLDRILTLFRQRHG